ncbi:MAG: rod shape-determining protein MreD [Kiloniellales bacterium]
MKQNVWQRLDLLARNLSPFAITILLVILGLVPLRVPDISPVLPSIAIIAVYYWSVHRPDLMPVWAVFLIGLIQELLSAGPMGVGILSLLLVHGIVSSQRRFFVSASLLFMWFAFALVAVPAMGAVWLLSSVYYGTMLDPGPAVFAYFLTVAFYPCLAWIFAQAQRAFLRQA